jgi:general secretion pathway protein D
MSYMQSVFRVGIISALLCSCASNPDPASTTGMESQTATVDYSLRAESTSPVEVVVTEPNTTPDDSAEPEYFDGSGKLFAYGGISRSSLARSGGGDIELQFRDASVRTVLDAVLKDMLGLRYQVDPSLTAKLTLETNGPVDADGLLFILETVLRAKGMALLKSGDDVRVVPLSQASRSAALHSGRSTNAGYTVQIVPLRYAVPSELSRVIEKFAPQGGVLAADDARSLLIIAGTSDEISTMLAAVRTFDIDWMAGMSFAMYDLQYAEAKQIAKELLEIFGDANSPIGGAVRLIPIERLNRLLAISSQPSYLRDIESWIERLDVGGSAPGRRIYVYHVQNGRASDLANSLNALFNMGNLTGQSQNAYDSGAQGQVAGAGSTGNFGSNRSTAASNQPLSGESNNRSPDSIRIVPSEENNSLLLLATPSEFGVIESALKRMDQAPRQVLIEASLAEVTLTDELRYGVQWFFESSDGQTTLSESTNGGISSAFPGFSYLYTGSSDVRAVLNALESMTDVKVISSPKLLVLNNQSASLRVGDEVPVPVQSAINTSDTNAPIVNTVEYRNTGVILEVTPRINEGGLIYLDVVQEVSDVAQTTSSGIDAPTIQQRKIESTVAVQGGETIALGGLIRDSDVVTKAGIPVLHKIPVLGNLFSRTGITNRRTELVVFLTPRIIRDAKETISVMEDLEKLLELEQNSFK